jgi:zinc transport system permease protein
VSAVYILFYNRIFAVTFDEAFASASGVNVKAFNLLISALTAITVVVGMKLIGAVMISAVIVVPAVTSMRLFKTFRAVVLGSAIFSVVSFALGFLFAVTFYIEKSGGQRVMLPVGATVVCFEIVVLLLVCIFKGIKTKKNTVH